MTKKEVKGFRKILTARVAELEHVTRNATGSRLREAPISWKKSKRLHNAPSRFVISTVISANSETPVRRFVESGWQLRDVPASAMRTSIRSGLPRVPWAHFVYSARKPSTAI